MRRRQGTRGLVKMLASYASEDIVIVKKDHEGDYNK